IQSERSVAALFRTIVYAGTIPPEIKVIYSYGLIHVVCDSMGFAGAGEIIKRAGCGNMQVHIYLDDSDKIQLLLQGQAQGAATFTDFDTFVRFIEGCRRFINSHANQVVDSHPEIPQLFLDAFDSLDT